MPHIELKQVPIPNTIDRRLDLWVVLIDGKVVGSYRTHKGAMQKIRDLLKNSG